MILSRVDLARAVLADHADLGAVVERQADVPQHDLLAVGLADVVHLEDELGRHVGGLFLPEKPDLFRPRYLVPVAGEFARNEQNNYAEVRTMQNPKCLRD